MKNIKKKKNKKENKLTTKEKKQIQEEKKKYKNKNSVIIEALKIVQEKRNWISDKIIIAISKEIEVSYNDIEEIATFYSQIFRKPVGKHIIKFCDSVVCYVNGYKDIQKKIEYHLKIKPGNTTEDNLFTLLPTCCLGNCNFSPTIMIDKDIYGPVNTNSVIQILDKYL
ncbi:NADH-quinone oxidoreductase subunit NuoE [Candidatus Purcelliella pentastirinorum]|uniref:NADH-quinone oxidoreductase subunit E n=1 Tax=Candidatus Purcelliella pentastirinorum TaxID=472834 RepID=A0AAX3N6Z8_9ENTR|nr:NADH-quinone oxidoreductase subunit NuoE [Candidatus Purcelliella pentastirinorum]WDI78357.1 NADH-quinone oxidoreductase subunit NuoE [Candidatus Purcelliella pentastirinorum]